MKIAILVPALGERDAIGTDALEMSAALGRMGHDVRLFAAVNSTGAAVASPDAIDAFVDRDNDVLIYHFAFGWPPGVEILKRVRCRRVVRYHNVTPPEFFDGWSEEYENACRAGREEIAVLAALGCELYLGASPFNVDDFIEAGVSRERTAVLAPFNRLSRLIETPANLDLLNELSDETTTWLTVGRLAPNKGHLDLFDAFATYLDRCDARARLLVIGSEDARLSRYNEAIREKIRSRRIDAHVRFLRGVDDSVLKAAYLAADALVSLSRHEGFCVPLAEAMALGTPVVALDRGAQAWTLGGAGLVWSEPDPALAAAAVERLRADGKLRSVLRDRGFERVAAAFASDALEAQLATVLGALR